MPKPRMLEVCVASLADARSAEQGGADRLELNVALELGGLTPTAGLLQQIKHAVAVPVIAMIRPRGAGFCYSESERQLMLRDAALLLDLGADGVACGALCEDQGTWQEKYRLAGELPCIGRIAFDPEMKFVAIGRQRDVKIYDATTFKELATLVGSDQAQISTIYPKGAGGICFSPDGTTLAVGTMHGSVQLWDLKLIRTQLAEMGLNW